MLHSPISTWLPRPLPRVCSFTIDQPSPFSTCSSSTGHQCKELRSGQASSWTVNLGRGASIQDVLTVGLEVSGGGGQQKQAVCQWCFVSGCSSSLPLVWTWILVTMSYLVALWWLCVLLTSVSVFLSLCLRPVCLILCISTFLCINPAHTSSAGVGLLLV